MRLPLRTRGTQSLLWVVVLFCTLLPSPLQGQDREALYLSVEETTGRLDIRIGNLFSDSGLTDALHSGLPLRIRVVVDLWKDGFFDAHKGHGEWRASVVFDPLEGRYLVASGGQASTETRVDSLAAVRDALQARFSMPLRPFEAGRYYYLGKIEVETLSLSDLEELKRWLRGDLAPAVAGDEEVGSAVGRGIGRVFVRILGLQARRFKVKTPVFEVRPPAPL